MLFGINNYYKHVTGEFMALKVPAAVNSALFPNSRVTEGSTVASHSRTFSGG